MVFTSFSHDSIYVHRSLVSA